VIFLLLVLPLPSPALEDRFDLLELNEVWIWDEEARQWRYSMTQLIGYDFHHKGNRVQWWTLYKPQVHTIRRDYTRQEYELSWADDQGQHFVRTKHFRHTDTPYDPELVNRAIWPIANRRKLTTRPEIPHEP
jgi:hypothetical protein